MRSAWYYFPLDVSNLDSIADAVRAATAVVPNGLDFLISNAGANPQPLASFQDLNIDEFIAELSFNTVSTIQVIRAFLPLIRQSQKKSITIMSSQLGSIEIGAMLPGLANAYSVSKASLNMLARKWSAELKTEGITVFMLHPGWVETEIGAGIEPWMSKYSPDTKKISPETSAVDCVKLFQSVSVEDAGAFFNHDGIKIPF